MEKLYSTSDVGAMLGVTSRRVQDYVHMSGISVSVQTTRRLKFSVDDVVRLKKWLLGYLIKKYNLDDVANFTE